MLITYLAGLVHTPDTGTRMLLLGSWGLLFILAADWTVLTVFGHRDPVHALRDAVNVIVTVGPGDSVPHGRAYSMFASVAMILTMILTECSPPASSIAS